MGNVSAALRKERRLCSLGKLPERDKDAWGRVFEFLGPRDLGRAQGVCRLWHDSISRKGKVCQRALNIPGSMDPASFLLSGVSGVDAARMGLLRTKVYDASSYRDILGVDIGPVPPIPAMISLERSGEPDPCDPTETIGSNYVWMWVPSYFRLRVREDFPFKLTKPDNPRDAGALRLVWKKEKPAEMPGRTTLLTIPNTIHNLGMLFRHLKKGKYDTIAYADHSIHLENERLTEGWVCMREKAIRKCRWRFSQYQADAARADVEISQLGHRVLFNLLRHGETGCYPDGRIPWTFALTSARFIDRNGEAYPTGCGGGGRDGLSVCFSNFDFGDVSAAVSLPVRRAELDP